MFNSENLIISHNYIDPEKNQLEIVERKGLGHPDTLADGLANSISVNYSKFCLDNFGLVLHHNVDKLYIGGGRVLSSFGSIQRLEPINVVINGRISDEFNGKKIDVEKIISITVKNYLKRILPALDEENDLNIVINCNQSSPNLSHPNWYKPKDIDDLPEYKALIANDTSVALSHSPMTTTENLVYQLERYFWEGTEENITPKFSDFGQDIKVMGIRDGNNIEITMCVPVMATTVKDINEYHQKVLKLENELDAFAKSLVTNPDITVNVKVNPSNDDKPRIYILGIGSCVEGGEEGMVGRGNDNNGVISVFRPHTVEAPSGKNPKYHTGKVLGYLSKRLSDAIYEQTGVKCSVITLTKNQLSLIPPSKLIISIDQDVDSDKLNNIISNYFLNVDYLKEILDKDYIY